MARPPRWSEVTAVFGGRFDPPHLGHREAVRGLSLNPGVKEVWILPSPTPPHKPAVASIEDRIEMTRLNFASLPEVKIDLREVERALREPHHPTYSYDTLLELRREVGSLAFVIGADQLEEFHRWHRFPEILTLCHWIVLARRPDGEERAGAVLKQFQGSGLLGPTGRVARADTFLTCIRTDAPAASSTEIREAIARTGQPPAGALSENVSAYLMQRRLYGTRPS